MNTRHIHNLSISRAGKQKIASTGWALVIINQKGCTDTVYIHACTVPESSNRQNFVDHGQKNQENSSPQAVIFATRLSPSQVVSAN